MNQPNSDSSGKWFAAAIVGVFVIGLFGIAAAMTLGQKDDIDNLPSTAAVELIGDALPALPSSATGGGIITTAETDPAAGMKAPDIIGTNFQGETVSIVADGRPKAVFFLAHWCGHCQNEVPSVVNAAELGLKPEGIDFYAVSTAVNPTRGNHPPSRWLRDEGWEFPTIRDSDTSEALAAYGQGGFPFVVYLDGDNNVLFRSSGELDPTVAAGLWLQTAESANSVG